MRRVLVRGHLRVPFKGFRLAAERASLREPLNPAQQHLFEVRRARALERRRLEGKRTTGPWYAAISAGIMSSIRRNAIGNTAFGRTMRQRKAGLARVRHDPDPLRYVRIGLELYRRRQAYDRQHPPPPPS